ncbi:MAG: ATPase [Azospirillum sp.]|nr:ATPase [Azospirillum sp.]
MPNLKTRTWRHWLFAAVALSVVALLVSHGVALAEEAAHAAAHEAAHGGGGGLPQLKPASFPPQLTWLAISFVLLYFLMSEVALPPVAEVLETRDGKIAYDLSRAEELKNESALIAAKVEEGLAEARAKAQAVLHRTTEEVHHSTATTLAELEVEITTQIKDAELSIQAARQGVLTEMHSVATGVAQEVLSRLLDTTVDSAEVAATVAQVIEERA